MARVPTLTLRVYAVENKFFGKHITVAGLLTGGDLAAQLADKELGQALLLPSVMLRHEGDLFLDNLSVSELSEKLGVPIRVTETNGDGLLCAIFGAHAKARVKYRKRRQSMGLPIIAIVGRPNVGKSTFFNKLAGERISIVEDTPGVTRDRIYHEITWGNRRLMLIDTGGIEPKTDSPMLQYMRMQA